MKIKKIDAVCRSLGQAKLFDSTDDDGVMRQWISTGFSVYPVERLPYLTEAQMCAVLDLSEKQLEKICVEHSDAPGYMDFRDAADRELPAEKMPLMIGQGDQGIAVYSAAGKTWFVNAELLEPILAEHSDAELWLRRTEAGTPYFAAKAGLLCVGLVWPMENMGATAKLLREIGDNYRESEK